jgi:very-short-patch-repair endonuclease
LVANLPIRTSGGYGYRADLAFPDVKVIVEYQSRFHDTTKNFTDDMTRKSRLEADGWHVIEVNAPDLDDPAELIARIRRVLSRRGARG